MTSRLYESAAYTMLQMGQTQAKQHEMLLFAGTLPIIMCKVSQYADVHVIAYILAVTATYVAW